MGGGVQHSNCFGELGLRLCSQPALRQLFYSECQNREALALGEVEAMTVPRRESVPRSVPNLGLAYSCRRSFIFVSRAEIESMSTVKTSARAMPQAPQLKWV